MSMWCVKCNITVGGSNEVIYDLISLGQQDKFKTMDVVLTSTLLYVVESIDLTVGQKDSYAWKRVNGI